jgi:hypothetical protein
MTASCYTDLVRDHSSLCCKFIHVSAWIWHLQVYELLLYCRCYNASAIAEGCFLGCYCAHRARVQFLRFQVFGFSLLFSCEAVAGFDPLCLVVGHRFCCYSVPTKAARRLKRYTKSQTHFKHHYGKQNHHTPVSLNAEDFILHVCLHKLWWQEIKYIATLCSTPLHKFNAKYKTAWQWHSIKEVPNT